MVMKRIEKEIAAGKFKAECLALMDVVAEAGAEYVITKRGKPVARLVPVTPESKPKVFGCMRGTAEEKGDLTAPVDATWEVQDNA
jgi:prevent-host-death family protein